MVCTLPTTAAYEAVMVWLDATTEPVLLTHRIDSYTGELGTRRITLTCTTETPSVDTDIPILGV